jgi:predicted transcriptional regulator
MKKRSLMKKSAGTGTETPAVQRETEVDHEDSEIEPEWMQSDDLAELRRHLRDEHGLGPDGYRDEMDADGGIDLDAHGMPRSERWG